MPQKALEDLTKAHVSSHSSLFGEIEICDFSMFSSLSTLLPVVATCCVSAVCPLHGDQEKFPQKKVILMKAFSSLYHY